MPDPLPRCGICRFAGSVTYAPPDQDISRAGTVKCRRRAPVITGGMMSPTMTVWPAVLREEWCGDFEMEGAP